MKIRYYVKFNYIDTEENRRVDASLFIDVRKPVESNGDLYDLQETLKHQLVQNGVKNFSKPRITDFRLEGVDESVIVPKKK